jgi:hypothetical protein
VAVHPVLGADGEALEVPAPDHRLPRAGLGVSAVLAQRLGDPGQLRGRGDIADQDPAGHEGVRDDVEALPRGEHVEDDPVDAAGLDHAGEGVDEVADDDTPGGVVDPEEGTDVAAGDIGEVLAPLERDEPAAIARSSDIDKAPEPTPASTTVAPGKMSAIMTIWPESFG